MASATAAQIGPRPTPAQHFAAFAQTVRAWMRRRFGSRSSTNEMNALNAHGLTDLGLSRREPRDFAREGDLLL